MTTFQEKHLVAWIERVALLVTVAYLGLSTLPRAWMRLNTDFPNYYLTARLAHEGFDTSRVYEWIWLQREKDHRSLDIPTIGLIPITPFSTLFIWPLSAFPALEAKRVWIIVNLALLGIICWFIHSLTSLSYRRIALILFCSFPLQRNLLYGQYYVLLLALIVAGCWCYVKEHYVLSGALIAVAVACKIFPVLLVVLFLRRRNWPSLASFAVTGIGTGSLSIAVFGWNLHRTYLYQILPWALWGEAMPPYIPSSASISTLLHYLLLSEPQWNPHPWRDSSLLYALLQPTLQMLLLAPAILLIKRNESTAKQIILEWIALLTAALTISTIPASYNFVLMVFPVCVLAKLLIVRRRYGLLFLLIVAYLGIGFPMPTPGRPIGPAILLFTPRLFLLTAVLVSIYLLLWQDSGTPSRAPDWTTYAWASLILVAVSFNVRSTLRREQAVREEFAFRLPDATQFLLHGDPILSDAMTDYLGFSAKGYRLVTSGGSRTWIDPSSGDDLSFASGAGHTLVERARSGFSDIEDPLDREKPVIEDARSPILSNDGQSLGFIRADHGRGRFMAIQSFQTNHSTTVALTPPSLNVYDAALLSPHYFAVSGVENGQPPQIYLTDVGHQNTPLNLGESRYPTLSPDGRWMAYSRLQHGMWNLWIRDQKTGITHQLAEVPCNQIQAAWESDSKTLVYANDCGRSLWFTAISRRQVIP